MYVYIYISINRILESGSYKGFMRTNGKDLIQQCIPDDWNVQDIFFMDVYNDWDIKAKLSHRTLINKDAKRKIFSSTLMLGKH